MPPKSIKNHPPKRNLKRRTAKRIVEHVTPMFDTQESLRSPLRDALRERFCQALLTASSATDAAIRAGYSPASARFQACRLLTNANIQRRLAGLFESTAHRSILRKRDVLKNASQRANAALVDIADLIGLPCSEFAARIQKHPAGRAIKRVRMDVKYNEKDKVWSPPFVKDIELFDPRGSERLLADLLGWEAPKRMEVTPGTTGRIIMLPAPEKPPVGVLPEGFWESQSLSPRAREVSQ